MIKSGLSVLVFKNGGHRCQSQNDKKIENAKALNLIKSDHNFEDQLNSTL